MSFVRRYREVDLLRSVMVWSIGLRVLLPAVLSWNLSSADVRDLGTAAAKSYHTYNYLTKLYSVAS